MKVIIFCNVIPDICGAFFHDISAGQYLKSRGHSVTLITVRRVPQQPLIGVFQNLPYKHYSVAETDLRASDIWTAPHHPVIPFVRRLNEKFQRPLVYTVHFGELLKVLEPYAQSGKWAEGALFISRHIKQYVESRITMQPPLRRMDVLYPIVFEHEISLPEQREPGTMVTLVNGNMIKGVDVFLRIANQMKDTRFLGVRPYYRPVPVHDTSNVTWINYAEDIRPILMKTRVMLVPSLTDSWSRVAFESMYNGIPVIYTKPYVSEEFQGGTTHGMAEWIGDAAIACDRTNIDEWVEALRSLEDPDVYQEWSEKGKAQTRSLSIFQNAEKYETFLKNFLRDFPPQSVQKKESQAPEPGPVGPLVAGIQRRPGQPGAPAFSLFRRPAPRR